ncbi:MAG: TonB-dependent receptor [Gammaproteobacteria bacterium]|nr:TonB-dependent receptor [Gammaproteobacteria bacterium]
MDPRHPCATALCTAALSLLGLLIAASVGAADADTADGDDDQEESATEEEAIEVPVLVEAAEIEVQPGHVRYDSEFIGAMPGGESNLADLLRANPAVDFGRQSSLSKNSAVQRPAEISIHGQPFYQNAFLIDGVDTGNDLNPADAEDVWHTPGFFEALGGGSPQGYYVDTNLIEQVEVYDSNVPAEYGGFTGGVVAADLKRYDGENSASLGYSLRRDEWEEFHVTDDDLAPNDYYNAGYTPDYRRSHVWAGIQRGVGDLGLSLSVSRRLSSFAQQYDKIYTIGSAGRRETQRLSYDDVIDNLFGRIDTDLAGTAVGVAFRHAKRRHDGLTSTTFDGRFEKDHVGNGLALDLERDLGKGRFEVGVAVDRTEDGLDSDSNNPTYHEYARGSPTLEQYEGAYGDRYQAQTRYSVKPKWTRAPLTTGDTEHRISIGGELQRTRSFFERPEDVIFELYWCVRDISRSEGCVDQDGDGVSSPGDEYLARSQAYYAGKVDLQYNAASFHAEDRVDIGRWQVNVGLRVDWNDYLDNVDVSPRLSTERDLFGNQRSVIIAGVNRYYGRSFFRYQLNDVLQAWYENIQYNPNGSVRRVLTRTDRSGRSDLATPYSDEWMLGWTQALGGTTVGLQFVNREGRDGVSRTRLCLDPTDTRCREYQYVYTNEGRSSTQSVGFRLSSSEPLRLGPTETTFSLGLGYKDSTNNRQDDAGYDEQISEDLIYYDGQLTTVEDLPPWDYNVPFGTSFHAATSIPGWNVTWSNFVNVRRGGTIARDSGLDCDDDEIDYCEGSYDIYEDVDFDGLVTVDARIEWRPQLMAEVSGYLRLEVKNLFDDVMDTNSSRFSSRRLITSGRLFWAEVGLRL